MEWIYIAFLIISFLYGSVGHGGASGYIALMVLLSYPSEEIKTNALILNIMVSSVAFLNYFDKNTFPWKLFITLAIFSIPMAYLGGMLILNDRLFKILLGLILLIPIIKFFGFFPNNNLTLKPNLVLLIIIGLGIGLLSGLLGIGGGILLSPIILLLGMCTVKQTSAISSLFILVNSVSGLLGKSQTSFQYSENLWLIAIFTIIGGFLGAYLGNKHFSDIRIKKILAIVLLIASIKLYFS